MTKSRIGLFAATAALSALFAFSPAAPILAQPDTPPPYLYYYSKMLGGLIVERADGTDSRLIGADVIPPNMTGLVGPGWSPSGKFFAATSYAYTGNGGRFGNPYLIDRRGASVLPWLSQMRSAEWMEWSPTGEDILLVVGSRNGVYESAGAIAPHEVFLWIIDAENGVLLAEFGTAFGHKPSGFLWDVAGGQIVFYLPVTFDGENYTRSRVTMRFDGTTLKQPVTNEEARANNVRDVRIDPDAAEFNAASYALSPSGNYEAHGMGTTILTDTRTGATVELPRHTQETVCRSYLWSPDERYLITLGGTLVAGGGCAGAVMGVTNSEGALWRELGGCWWISPCFGWLPDRIDVNSLPPGSPTPVQRDPVRIEYDDDPVFGPVQPTAHIFCSQYAVAVIADVESGEELYRLNYPNCSAAFGSGERGVPILFAENPSHNLLATYLFQRETAVSVWRYHTGGYGRVLRLNTDGYQLEFTDDGKFLRARNIGGWKVFDISDLAP